MTAAGIDYQQNGAEAQAAALVAQAAAEDAQAAAETAQADAAASATTVAGYEARMVAEEAATAELYVATSDATVLGTATLAALQAALDAAGAAGGGTVVVPPAMTIDLTAQVTHPSNVTLHLAEGARLERSWTSTNGDKGISATIKNENAPDYADYLTFDPFVPGTLDTGCAITGPGTIGLSAAARAFADGDPTARMPQLYYVGCDDFRWEHTAVEAGGRDWACTLHGDRHYLAHPRVLGGSNVYEDGIHVLGGTAGRIVAPHIESGDDALAFGGNYDCLIDDWVVTAPVVVAQRGHAFRALRYREGSTAGFGPFTTDCRNIKVTQLTGSAGLLRNSAIRIDEDVASAGTLHGIDLDGFDLAVGDVGTHDLTNAQAINLAGGTGKIRGRIRNPINDAVRVTNGASWSIDLDTAATPQQGTARTVRLTDAGDITLAGTIVAPTGASAVDVVSCDRLTVPDLTVLDVVGSAAGIAFADAATVVELGRLVVRKAAAAVGARGLSFTAATAVRIFDFVTDCQSPIFGSATAGRIESRAITAATRTIAAGSFTIQGESIVNVLCEGGVTDSLATIAGGYIGQEIEVRNAEADPATAVLTLTTTGNLAVGSTRTLDAAGKGVRLRWTGAKWVLLDDWTT